MKNSDLMEHKIKLGRDMWPRGSLCTVWPLTLGPRHELAHPDSVSLTLQPQRLILHLLMHPMGVLIPDK